MRSTLLSTSLAVVSLLPSILAMEGHLTVLMPSGTWSQKRAGHGGDLLGKGIDGGSHEFTFTKPNVQYFMWEGPPIEPHGLDTPPEDLNRVWHQECSVFVREGDNFDEEVMFELRDEREGFKGDMNKPVHIQCEEAHCNVMECVIPFVNSVPPKHE